MIFIQINSQISDDRFTPKWQMRFELKYYRFVSDQPKLLTLRTDLAPNGRIWGRLTESLNTQAKWRSIDENDATDNEQAINSLLDATIYISENSSQYTVYDMKSKPLYNTGFSYGTKQKSAQDFAADGRIDETIFKPVAFFSKLVLQSAAENELTYSFSELKEYLVSKEIIMHNEQSVRISTGY